MSDRTSSVAVRVLAVEAEPAHRAELLEARAGGYAFYKPPYSGAGPPRSCSARTEAMMRRAAGERLASIAKSYAVYISMISRL